MAQTKQQVINSISILIISFIIFACANQLSPPGGEVDEIAPTVIYSYPEEGKTNFNDNELEFSFSEYVNKRNISEAFFISPRLEGRPEFSWTRKTVYVELPESLSENTTYSIIIGTEITDVNNNNNMTEPFRLTFSTGAKIDSGKISGKVYTDKADGTLMFAYTSDTASVIDDKPNYLSQIDENGFYEFSGLGFGSYTIFAVKDEFKDLIYNIGDDQIGVPINKIQLDSLNKIVNENNYFIYKQDTLAPNIQAVTMTDQNHIIVEFSEAIDSSRISNENFNIVDSTKNDSFPIKYLFKTNAVKNEYILAFSDSLDIEGNNYLNTTGIFDKYDNELTFSSNNFIVSDKKDTNEVKLLKVATKFDKMKIDYDNPSFYITFSDAFDKKLIKNDLQVFDPDSMNIPFDFEKINDAVFKINISTKLKEMTTYRIMLDMKNIIDAAGNQADTIITKKVTTLSELDFSGISGIVKTKAKNVFVVLKELSNKPKLVQTNVDINNVFSFEKVLPGNYLVWAFIDADSNAAYTNGTPDLNTYSEFFKYYPDTLNLRARWPIGDVEIDLTN